MWCSFIFNPTFRRCSISNPACSVSVRLISVDSVEALSFVSLSKRWWEKNGEYFCQDYSDMQCY